ncbi:MAG: dihydroorotate dehydrogenase (quinone), partial [Proteobacteria bacterium]|nr:dihydroorotate dehydrogenase (quinone) [Pseudomonadota bacterium]
NMYKFTRGSIPIVGLGGVSSAADAYAKIRAGASLVQIYTSLIYQGFGLVTQINRQLPELLKRDGFAHLKDAIGVDAKK